MKSSQEIPLQSKTPIVTGGSDQSDTYRSIIALASRAKAKPTFYREAFRKIAQYFNSPYATLSVHLAASVIEDAWHTGPTDPEFWKNSIQGFLTDCLADNRARIQQFNSTRAEVTIALAACPLVDDNGDAIGAMALAVSCENQQQARFCLAEIQGLTNLISACANSIGQAPSRGQGQSGLALDQCDILSRTAAYSSKHEMGIAITNKLRNKIGCDQIAMGMVKHRRVKILAISGFDDVPPRSPGAAKIRAAMEECLDRNKPIVFQKDDDWEGQHLATDHRLHQQWSVAAGGDAVATIPLAFGDKTACILSLRRQADQPFTREEIEKIRGLVEPLVPGIALVERANRPLIAHVRDTVGQAVQGMIHPQKPLRIAMIFIAALCMGWFLIGTVPYRITVPCVVVPDRVQHISAPFDGIIKAAHVTAGDQVTRGQILYELDTTELELEQDRLLANIAVATIEIDRAIAAKLMVNAKLAHTRIRVFEVQLKIVRQKLNQATSRAPFSGTVIQGDLRKQVGQIVNRGTPIFEIAPNNGWLLELEVPDVLAGDVNAGLTAAFAPQARPEQSQACRILRVRPTAELRNGKNVFIAEAKPDSKLDWLRPGMEGVTRVEIGPRPVRWVTMHRVVNYLRLKLWL